MQKLKKYIVNSLHLYGEWIWLFYHFIQCMITFLNDGVNSCIIGCIFSFLGLITVSNKEKDLSHFFIFITTTSLIPSWLEFYIKNNQTTDSNIDGIATSIIVCIVLLKREKLIKTLTT